MTINMDDTPGMNGAPPSYNAHHHQHHRHGDSNMIHRGHGGENTSLLGHSGGAEPTDWTRIFQHISPGWVPSDFEDEPSIGGGGSSTRSRGSHNNNNNVGSERYRSFRRKFFLFLTEPDTSVGSALLFFVIIFAISLSIVIMIMQSMETYQYTPTDCRICGGNKVYLFDDDASVADISSGKHRCVCPPQPFPYLQRTVDYLLYFFALEWTLRVISFCPAHPQVSLIGQLGQWVGYLTSTSMLIDALAIWPYFFAALPRGLVSLRLFRLLRLFQLVRLGQYNRMFAILTNVLWKSAQYLKLMALLLLFGAIFFGSIMYWLEQGQWKYWEPTGDYQYVRTGVDGVTEEISPYNSIPAAFWWFIVTATTVGYGDYYPTSTGGQWVAVLAMLSGVLVIAFPVSVFSDLFSEELKDEKGFEALFQDDTDDNDNNDIHSLQDIHGSHHTNVLSGSLESGEIRRARYHHGVGSDPELRSLSNDPMYVVMEKEDLNDIITSIYSIQQNQKRVQKILRKYCDHDK